MCNGNAFRSLFKWRPLLQLAKDLSDVPNTSGVYCVWVSKTGSIDISRIIDEYKNGPLLRALRDLANASRVHFRAASLSEDYGWERVTSVYGIDSAIDRVERLPRIQIPDGRLDCPLLYLGTSRRLRTRLDELMFGGHTVNHSIWPLLIQGWELDFGWTEDENYRGLEESLKQQYKATHSGSLPPLMVR